MTKSGASRSERVDNHSHSPLACNLQMALESQATPVHVILRHQESPSPKNPVMNADVPAKKRISVPWTPFIMVNRTFGEPNFYKLRH